MEELCVCCNVPIGEGESFTVDSVWGGRLNGYCYNCATCRCDAYPEGAH